MATTTPPRPPRCPRPGDRGASRARVPGSGRRTPPGAGGTRGRGSGLQAGARRVAQARVRLGTPGVAPGPECRGRRSGSSRRGHAGGSARSLGSGSGTAAWGGNEGGGARSPAQRGLGARGSHPAGLRPPRGSGLLGRSPGQPRRHRQSGRSGPMSWRDFREPGGASPPARTALAGDAGSDPKVVPSDKPSWTPGSAAFQPLDLCVRGSENRFPESKEVGGGQRCGCGRERRPPTHPGISVPKARMTRANLQSADLQKSTDFSRA